MRKINELGLACGLLHLGDMKTATQSESHRKQWVRQSVVVAYSQAVGGPRSVEAEVKDGLAVHRTIYADGRQGEGWRITHVKSGLKLYSFRTRVSARNTVTRIASFTDWTQPVLVIYNDTRGRLTELIAILADLSPN